MSEVAKAEFVRQSRGIVKDLFRPNPVLYWTDFLCTIVVGYTFGGIYLLAPMFSVWQVVGFIVAGFCLYRVGLFMHEVVHFRASEMRGFKLAYDLIAGIVMLSPSFFYATHLSHHNTHEYGTDQDGEYLPLGTGPMHKLFLFLAQITILPLFVAVRFGLTPISYLHPRLRRWTLERASSFVIDFSHRRHWPEGGMRKSWIAIEWLCCFRVWAIFIFIGLGINEWTRVPQLYCLAAFTLGINHIRTLAAHRYLNRGERMSHADQFFDSTNIEGKRTPIHNFLTELLCPVGSRYHGLHHLFPSMPYHNLGVAHRRLIQQLPESSGYHDTVYPNARSVFAELVQNIRQRESRAKSQGELEEERSVA